MHAEVYQPDHLPGLYPLFMPLTTHKMTLDEFVVWFERNAKEAVVFMDQWAKNAGSKVREKNK